MNEDEAVVAASSAQFVDAEAAVDASEDEPDSGFSGDPTRKQYDWKEGHQLLGWAQNLLENINQPLPNHQKHVKEFVKFLETEILQVPEHEFSKCSTEVLILVRNFQTKKIGMSLTEDNIVTLSNAIGNKPQLSTLGLQLGFNAAQVAIYQSQNVGDTFQGTLNMLNEWQNRTPDDQTTELRKTLQKSGLSDVAKKELS